MILDRRSIRRALEAPIAPALVTAGVCLDDEGRALVQFANMALDSRGLRAWVRFTVHYANPQVLGMGPTGLTKDTGQTMATVYTKGASAADLNDTIAGIIETAYPYNAILTFNGVEVILAETQHADGVSDGPWWTSQVKTVWSRWRNQG